MLWSHIPKFSNIYLHQISSMTTITLITGANQGIGLATAKILAKEYNYHVIIASRNLEAGAKAAEALKIEGHQASSIQLDLTSQSSINAAASTIKAQFGRLDVLVNNAGILLDGKEPNRSFHNLLSETMTTNVIGTALVTEAMIPLLRLSPLPRLIFVSSRMGSLHQATVRDTPFFNIDYKVYDASKAATNMLALNYARILEDVDARVNVVCPGLVATNLTGYIQWGTSTEVGAQRIVDLATLRKDNPTATFSDSNGIIAW